MQKMTTQKDMVFGFLYYALAIAFHAVLLFTGAGNYFHGGTPAELIGLQLCAVVIVFMLLKSLSRMRLAEKVFAVICTVIPFVFLTASLVSIAKR